MSGLTRHPGRRRGLFRWLRDDRGGVTTLVAVLLGGGVLLGMGALVLDVGSLYAERETLQTRADAAAMVAGKTCAKTAAGCVSAATAAAGTYANVNGYSGLTTVCGVLAGSGLPACPAPATNLTRCLNTPTGQYIEVRVHTVEADGSTLLPPILARALAGNAGDNGTTVAACARVAFGPPATGQTPSFTLSICEWDAMTGGGGSFPPPPPYAPDPTSTLDSKPIYLHNTTGATTCPAGPSGWDAPGGFGWLDPTLGGSPCSTTITAAGTAGGNTGASVSTACKTVLAADRAAQTVLLVPVYDGLQGTGTGTTYHIAGLAAFVLTGYHLPGFTAPSSITGKDYCTGSTKCLYGVFFKALIPATGTIGGEDLGASIVTLVG